MSRTCSRVTERSTRADVGHRPTRLPGGSKQHGEFFARERRTIRGNRHDADAVRDRHGTSVQRISTGFHPGQIHHRLQRCRRRTQLLIISYHK